MPSLETILLTLHRRRNARRTIAMSAAAITAAIALMTAVDLITRPTCVYPRTMAARDDARLLIKAVEQFQLRADRCPRDAAELRSFGVVSREPVDPWGRPYWIVCQGDRIRVCSGGPDPAAAADDICVG